MSTLTKDGCHKYTIQQLEADGAAKWVPQLVELLRDVEDAWGQSGFYRRSPILTPANTGQRSTLRSVSNAASC